MKRLLTRGALLLLLCMALPCAATAEQADARRVVYLTFDDGPSNRTAEVLDILQSRYLSGCMVWKEAVHREMPGF